MALFFMSKLLYNYLIRLDKTGIVRVQHDNVNVYSR